MYRTDPGRAVERIDTSPVRWMFDGGDGEHAGLAREVVAPLEHYGNRQGAALLATLQVYLEMCGNPEAPGTHTWGALEHAARSARQNH